MSVKLRQGSPHPWLSPSADFFGRLCYSSAYLYHFFGWTGPLNTSIFATLPEAVGERGGGHFQASFGRGPGAALGAPHHVVQHVGPPVGHVQGDQLHAAALSGALVHTEWRPGGARGGG